MGISPSQKYKCYERKRHPTTYGAMYCFLSREELHKESNWCVQDSLESGIVPFMEAQGLKVYNPSIGAMFIDTCHYNGRVRPQEREKIRSMRILTILTPIPMMLTPSKRAWLSKSSPCLLANRQ